MCILCYRTPPFPIHPVRGTAAARDPAGAVVVGRRWVWIGLGVAVYGDWWHASREATEEIGTGWTVWSGLIGHYHVHTQNHRVLHQFQGERGGTREHRGQEVQAAYHADRLRAAPRYLFGSVIM